MRSRHAAGFGKRIEFWVIGRMMKGGLDVYVPLVDDMGIDAVVRRADGTFAEVQIKARSADAIPGDAALFSAISHESRPGYWFVFYSERLEKTWVLSSEEFIAESRQDKTGKNVGRRSLCFNGSRNGKRDEYAKERYAPYEDPTFLRLRSPAPLVAHQTAAVNPSDPDQRSALIPPITSSGS